MFSSNLDMFSSSNLISLGMPKSPGDVSWIKIIKGIYKAYLEVGGSDLIGTNTFSLPTIAMADYEMEDYVYELNYAGAHLAREACDDGALRNNSTFADTRAICGCFNSISSALI
jgi:methionine synthase I (cobalamin-dependent)